MVGHGVEGGLAAGPEAGDGPSGPAAQGPDERCSLVEHAPGPGDLEGHQGPQRRRCRRAGGQLAGGARRSEPGRRPAGRCGRRPASSATSCQCSASCSPVQIASDQATRSGVGGVEDGQDQSSDRVGGQPAVADQVVEGGVAADHLVLPVGGDQIRGGQPGSAPSATNGTGGVGHQRVEARPCSGSARARSVWPASQSRASSRSPW